MVELFYQKLKVYLYPAISLEVPNNIIKEVDTNIFHFIWRNRYHYIKKLL